jgi:Cu2+-exporting ATPase
MFADLLGRTPPAGTGWGFPVLSVSFVASGPTSLHIGGFDVDFWWELALLVVIMLLGHRLEMRALGEGSSALDALAALLPDQANRVRPGGGIEAVGLDGLALGDVVLVRPGARVPATIPGPPSA